MHKQDTGTHKTRRRLAMGLALLWLAGCYPPSAVDQNWGNSVRNNLAQQVLNPQAGLNPAPPVGLPPQAAVNEMENYDKSFSPESQKAPQLIYGTTSSGGQSSGY
jgi:hypothetical protein